MSESPQSAYDVLNETVEPAMYINIDYRAEATDEERAAGDEVAREFDLAEPARRPRPLYAIHADVKALSVAQSQAVAGDLFGGNPPKVDTDTGPNAPDLLVIKILRQTGSLSAADKRLTEQAAMAIYALDNPNYLVHPPFDPSINVPGDEADV